MKASVSKELNAVVLKAMEKEPSRRYASAAEFADDVRRYLQDRPVLARPASSWYHLRLFAKRNKALVAALAGCEGTGFSGRDAELARQRAGDFFVSSASPEGAILVARGQKVAVEPAPGFCLAEDSIETSNRAASKKTDRPVCAKSSA